MSRPREVKRGIQSYQECTDFTISEIERLVAMYSVESRPMARRLIRDSIDHHIRRCQGYSIRGNFGSHYREVGLDNEMIFEHVIPASLARDNVLTDIYTAKQAINVPTCFISKKNDALLRKGGLVSSTPDANLFFKRYELLGIEIQTFDGKKIDQSVWTLEDHFKYFP